jgi:hypothetical protein
LVSKLEEPDVQPPPICTELLGLFALPSHFATQPPEIPTNVWSPS